MKAFKRTLISLAGLVLLVFIFYGEEDWRGGHDWENCKREFAARAISLDWNDYIPLPVPDAQNFFEAPNMQKCFAVDIRANTNEFAARFRDKKFGPITDSVTRTNNLINSVSSAKDYLAWSDQFKPDFDSIRSALARPYARIYGSYSIPFGVPFPDYVNVRLLAQVLAQRAHCYLLLNQPADALRELTLLDDFTRILKGAPEGRGTLLVSAMIDVAVNGVYAKGVADGIRLHSWQEPQLAALQAQLRQIDLLPIVANSFRYESASSCQTLQMLFFKRSPPHASFWQNVAHLRFPEEDWIPRGWIYQNMVVIATLKNDQNGIDLENETFIPGKVDDVGRQIEGLKPSPYTFLACIAVPNIAIAWRTTAYNQTLVNEAQIACALERYRLAHGEYPESLDVLVPQFIEAIPHDIIGGQPLHYRRTSDEKFLLYSVGWNETDDGGRPSPTNSNGTIDYANGDWVWPNR